jgi:lysophospholipase L1-like esterase
LRRGRAVLALVAAVATLAMPSAQARSPALPVLFLGASVMDYWKAQDPAFFKAHPDYVVRGIPGQTSGQILGRAPHDLAQLNPFVVVLLAGSNDIAAGTRPEAIVRNLAAIVDLVRARGGRVVLLALTNAAPAVNALIGDYARRETLTFVDFASLRVADGGFRPDLTFDGLHPTPAGYRLMEPLVQAAIDRELAAP